MFLLHFLRFSQTQRVSPRVQYLELQKPLYERRRAIVAGDAKPTAEEIAAGIEETKKDKDDYEGIAIEGEAGAIPEFWLTTLRNHPGITELITDRDADALKALTDIQISYLPAGEAAGYKLHFYFKPNDYFTDEVLTKTYLYQAEVGYTGDFIYDKAVGSEIHWKAEKDLTKTFEIKKQRNKSKLSYLLTCSARTYGQHDRHEPHSSRAQSEAHGLVLQLFLASGHAFRRGD